MLTIKLSRIGKRKQPMYRLIITEKGRDPFGDSLEILGSYNPFSKEIKAKKERIDYWLGKGARMTPSINNLLIEKKIIEGKKVTASNKGKKAIEAEKAAAKTKHEKPKPEPEAEKPAEPEIVEEPKIEEKTEENNV
jgi:small subunit ribosomal protein S16